MCTRRKKTFKYVRYNKCPHTPRNYCTPLTNYSSPAQKRTSVIISCSHITIQFSFSSCDVDFTFYCSIIVILNYCLFFVSVISNLASVFFTLDRWFRISFFLYRTVISIQHAVLSKIHTSINTSRWVISNSMYFCHVWFAILQLSYQSVTLFASLRRNML